MIVATLATRNFEFQAFGSDESQAREALIAGLRKHGQQMKLSANWFEEIAQDIQTTSFEMGCCLRDREPLIQIDAQSQTDESTPRQRHT